MTEDAVFAGLPEITEETRRRVELQFEHYIWYEGNGARGKREYMCSCCHAEWRQDKLREETPEDKMLYAADHGEEVVCPRCGETAKLMCLGKIRSGWRYSQAFGISVFAAAKEDEVWIRTYRVSVNYGSYYARGTGAYAKAKPNWEEVSRHRIFPGGAEYWHVGWYGKNMSKSKKPHDYYNNRNWEDVRPGDCANAFVFQTPLADTFLRYCAWNEYALKWSTSPALYLCAYAVRPTIEMAVKLGYSNVVRDLINEGVKNVRVIDWSAARPWAFFRMSREEYAEWQARGGDLRMRKIYAGYRGHGNRWAATQEEYDAVKAHWYLGSLWIKSAARAAGVGFAQVLHYLEAQAEAHKTGLDQVYYKWKDYYEAAKKCGYNIRERAVLMPKDVMRTHDDAVELLRQIREETQIKEAAERAAKKENAFLEQVPKYKKKYTASDGVYMIRVPESTKEIVNEGQALGHCVGRMGYIEAMAEGRNGIVFLRRCDAPDVPWFTIEVSQKRIVQCEGAKRHDGKAGYYGHLYRDDLPEDAAAFLDAWEAKVCKKEEPETQQKEIA